MRSNSFELLRNSRKRDVCLQGRSKVGATESRHSSSVAVKRNLSMLEMAVQGRAKRLCINSHAACRRQIGIIQIMLFLCHVHEGIITARTTDIQEKNQEFGCTTIN